MATAILITLITTFGLMFSVGKEGKLQKVITIGLAVCILLPWTGERSFYLISLLLQLALAVTSTVYALSIKDLNILERITIGSTGLLLTIGTFLIIQLWPGQNIFRLSLIVPITLFLWTTIKHGQQQPKEFGFMLIWITLSVFQLSNFLTS